MNNQTMCLYEKTIHYLAELIEANLDTPNYKLPTEMELSKQLGISRMTAITAYKAIGATGVITRIKSKGTFISPNATKDALQPLFHRTQVHTQKKIGVILPSLLSSHTLKIFSGIAMKAYGNLLLVASTEMNQETECECIQSMLDQNVDGLILYPVDDDNYNDSLLNLALKNFPVILTDRNLPGLNFSCVSSDNKTMLEKGLNVLFENGHRHILFFLSNKANPQSIQERKEYYIETLQKKNILTQYIFNGDSNDVEKIKSDLKEYLKAHPDITAVLTADYTSSACLKQIFDEWQVDVPNAMEVVYIDIEGANFTPLFKNQPTHICQNSQEIGETAARLLLEKLSDPKKPKQIVNIQAELILGYSTK